MSTWGGFSWLDKFSLTREPPNEQTIDSNQSEDNEEDYHKNEYEDTKEENKEEEEKMICGERQQET